MNSSLSETQFSVWLFNPQTALRLSGVIEIMPLRGIIVAIADNQFFFIDLQVILGCKSKILRIFPSRKKYV